MRLSLLLLTLAFAVSASDDANVVKIFTSNGGRHGYCATAFFISPTRLITAGHTFNHNTTHHYIQIGENRCQVNVVKVDFERDICVLETVEYKSPTWYSLQLNGTIKLKGFRGEDRSLSEESVTRRKDRIETKNTIIDGESGGPLVNESGQVIGMGVQSHGGTCVSVSSDTILKFLSEVDQDKH